MGINPKHYKAGKELSKIENIILSYDYAGKNGDYDKARYTEVVEVGAP